MLEDEIEAVVIGAGAVGLACAAAMARSGMDVLVLEATGLIGSGVSSRNSEVIHAGIYYTTGSLQHRYCVHGRRRLYPYLASRGVAHRKSGKLIVATSADQEGKIGGIYDQAKRNGVENIALLSGEEARALEPNLACAAAMLSPETGIIDSHGYMLALLGDLEAAGGAIAFEAPVLSGAIEDGRIRLDIGGAHPMRLSCKYVVNSAGLHAQRVANAIDGVPKETIPALVLAKGSYFGAAGKPAFERLIYPAPVEGGLGVHLTLDLAGRMRFGPDVEWLAHNDPDAIDYTVDLRRADSFYEAIRKYWPALKDDALTPDYSGCRPKIFGRGQPAADFRIDGPEIHGVPGLVNLFGIESPGLTSSPAIAEAVLARLEGHAPRAYETLRPAIFLDRDGTLNEDAGYVHKAEDLNLLPGAIEAVRMANRRGWRVIVVTNQAGIGRGFYDEAAMHRFNDAMQQELSRSAAHIDAFYFAPHHAEAIHAPHRHADHPDRKPNPGMILRAFREWDVDPLRSLMIGDRDGDVEAAHAAGIGGALYTGGRLDTLIADTLATLDWAKP